MLQVSFCTSSLLSIFGKIFDTGLNYTDKLVKGTQVNPKRRSVNLSLKSMTSVKNIEASKGRPPPGFLFLKVGPLKTIQKFLTSRCFVVFVLFFISNFFRFKTFPKQFTHEILYKKPRIVLKNNNNWNNGIKDETMTFKQNYSSNRHLTTSHKSLNFITHTGWFFLSSLCCYRLLPPRQATLLGEFVLSDLQERDQFVLNYGQETNVILVWY